MKTIGLIGGMSAESTTVYYQALNRLVRARLGGIHSAELVVRSVDSDACVRFARRVMEQTDPEQIGALLAGLDAVELGGVMAVQSGWPTARRHPNVE